MRKRVVDFTIVKNTLLSFSSFRFAFKTGFFLSLLYLVGAGAYGVMGVLTAMPAAAAQTIPYKVNFQGRLTDTTGAALVNGSYNIKFKLYDAPTGGTLLWSEDWVAGAVDNRVPVENGLFSVQLGSIAALSPSLFNSSAQRYLEVELPTPATARCSTNGCAAFTEGPMTPRNTLASAAYAFNADTIDGIDGASLLHNDQNGTLTGSLTVTNGLQAGGDTGMAATLEVLQGAAQTGVLIRGNGATDLFAPFTFAVQSGDGTNRLYYQESINQTTVEGGSSFWDTPALQVKSTNAGAVAQRIIGASGQTADILQVRNSSNVSLFTVGATGATTLKNAVDSTSAFNIQNASGAALLNVDTINNTVTLLGGTTGEVAPWTTSPNPIGQPTPTPRFGGGSVTYNGYLYVLGGSDGTARQEVQYSKLNADGSISTWSTTTPLPSPRWRMTVAAVNGYVYVIGGHSGTAFQSSTYFAKANSDGTLGPWNATTAIGIGATGGLVSRANHATIVANGYIYVIGGQDGVTNALGNTYYAKVNSDGTLSGWTQSTNAFPGAEGRYFGTATTANGYVYYIAGKNIPDAAVATVFYAKLNAGNGSIGAWSTSSNPLPGVRSEISSIVSNGYIYAISGNDTVGVTTTLYYAKANGDGTTGGWTLASNGVPAGRASPFVTIANGYIYYMGGSGGGVQSTVFYTTVSRLKIGASIDLVGLQGQTLADPGDGNNGTTGGSVTAGNGLFVGALEVRGQATFSGSLSVNGIFSAKDGITVGQGFSTTDTTAANLNLDSSITFTEAAGSCNSTTGGGAMYYNSTTTAIRMCLNGGWEDVVTTAGLGLLLFGVMPDSGTNPGDLAAVTGVTNGPCKVSVGANTTTVAWKGCTAYSGGRKVVVNAGSATTANTVANNFQHLCLIGTNGQPALSPSGTEVANLATSSFPSLGGATLCLADIKFTGANNTITQIYDTRTYTTSQKEAATIGTTAPALGHLVQYSTTKGVMVPMATLNGNKLSGVVVATTGAVSTTAVNAIIVTSGPAAVKSITGTNIVGDYLFGSATAGYASTVATKPTDGTGTIYNVLGVARTAWSGATACAVNADACAGSILTTAAAR
jgi:hypothetical protein